MLISVYPDIMLFMKQASQSFKALADETRLRIIALLTEGELCVCDMVAVLELPQSTVSRHLSYLKNNGWVIDRRQGLWVHYRLADGATPFQVSLLASMPAKLAEMTQAQQDLKKLKQHLRNKGRQACA